MTDDGQAVAGRPVFVDGTGRRARLLHWGLTGLGLLLGSYVLLVLAALVVPPGTLSLTVPGLGPVLPKSQAPALTTRTGEGTSPAVLASARPRPQRTKAVETNAVPVVSRSPNPAGNVPGAGRTASPSPAASPTHGRATSHPTPQPHATRSKPPHP